MPAAAGWPRHLLAAALALALLAGAGTAGATSGGTGADGGEEPAAAPANDDFPGADLATPAGQVDATIVDASAEPGEPGHGGEAEARRSIWWSWTAPADGWTTLDASAQTFRPVVAVYTGGAVDALTEVDAATFRNIFRTRVRFVATAGTTYRIALDRPADQPDDELGLSWGPTTETFLDVGVEHELFDEVEWMHWIGLSTGYAGGTYRPADPVTRQAMAAFLFRLAGSLEQPLPPAPTFADVPADHPFYEEVEWLADTGVAQGYADGTFKPGTAISRQAMAAFLHRTADLVYKVDLPEPPEEATFPDVPVDHPFFAEVEWMAGIGITTGYGDGTYRPAAPITRQAMAAFLYRMTEWLIDAVFPSAGAPPADAETGAGGWPAPVG